VALTDCVSVIPLTSLVDLYPGIEGHVSWGEDDPDIGARVVTALSLQHVQIRVSMRDAELFSLTFGCTQQPHYTQCQWKYLLR
jgi:hypothetical protein